MTKPLICKQDGLSLLELLIAMAISLVVLAAISSTFIAQNKLYTIEEQVNEMTQTARAAVDMISRDIEMAGYDPSSSGIVGLPYHSTYLQILSDLNGDGDTDDQLEDIRYTFDASGHKIVKATKNGSPSLTFADNIESFSVNFLDEDGNSTTTSSEIRRIIITLTCRTARSDPAFSANSGYRTCTLSATITPPNLII